MSNKKLKTHIFPFYNHVGIAAQSKLRYNTYSMRNKCMSNILKLISVTFVIVYILIAVYKLD